MNTKTSSIDSVSVTQGLHEMKYPCSPLITDYHESFVIKHEGLGKFGAHKYRSAAWIWETRVGKYGIPKMMADRSSGTWALANSRVGALYGVKSYFVTVGNPAPNVREQVEANNGQFIVVKTNAERKAALQKLIIKGAWCPDQHNNPQVIDAFRDTLGKETATDLQTAGIRPGDLQFVVAAVGTGGSGAGLSLGLHDAGYDQFEVIGFDSTTSMVAGSMTTSPPLGITVPGVGSSDEVCRTFQKSRTMFQRLVRISPLLAAEAAADFQLFNKRGCGMSSGLALAGARQLLPELHPGKKILILFADDASRYGKQIEKGKR